MKSTTKSALPRRLGLQTVKGTWQRLSVSLMLLMLTTATAWAENVTVTESTTAWTNGNTYYVTSDVTITERITVTGDVTLNLGEGCTLTAEKGITVVGGDGNGNKVDGKPNGNANSLTIEGTGTLNADMSKGGTVAKNNQLNAAAIGGGVFNSHTDYQSWCGNITINGGTVYALSGNGAAIGCSAIYNHVTNSGGTITINGGNVTAISKTDYGAGIGGSYCSEAGTININGGTVTAEAYGAGHSPAPGATIGNGGYTNGTRGGGTITITGGQITATQGYNGIGYGGYHGNETMTVNLSWTAATDFIDVKSIDASTLTFTKAFLTGEETCMEQTAENFAGKKMIPADHKVTFDAGASSSTYNLLGVKDGTAISAPAIDPVPTDAMLSFAGWTTDGSTPYDFSAAVTNDLTLTAAYKHDFNVNNMKHLYDYTGSAINLGYTVTNTANGSALTSPTDYIATIKNEEKTVVTEVTAKGIYTLTVTGQGTFAGIVKTYEFAVDAATTLGSYDFIDLGNGIYGISTVGLLEDLAAYTNANSANTKDKTFKLTRDIDFDATQGNNHTPIGTHSQPFNGTFDGQGHIVSGIRISQTNGQYLGLFGNITFLSTVKHVKMSNAVIEGYMHVGGIVGWNSGTVTDCVADATVTIGATRDNATRLGGIAGWNSSTTVSSIVYGGIVSGCASAASISHNGHGNVTSCGGIVGSNYATLTSSIYTGSSVDDDYINFGYLVGDEGSDGIITNCYHTGTDANTKGIYKNEASSTKYTTYQSGHAQTISAGEYVTSVGFSGTATEYATSGITTYADGAGMLYSSTLYATHGETISLVLSSERTGYTHDGYNCGTVSMKPDSSTGWTSSTKWTAKIDDNTNMTIAGVWLYELTIDGTSDTGLPSDAAAHNGEKVNVTFQRTFPWNKKQTVCLPFAPDALFTVGQVWEFTGVENGMAVMTELEKTTDLNANTPYIFEYNKGAAFTSLRFEKVTLDIGSDPKTPGNGAGELVFHGTYEQKTWEADDAVAANIYGFMLADNDGQEVGQFVKARRKTILRPFSCWLHKTTTGALSGTQTASARGMARGTDDEPEVIGIIWRSATGETTGIGSINLRTGEILDNADGWFSLDGRRLSCKPSQRGVYINKGKKVIIK